MAQEDTNFRDAARDGDVDLMQTLAKKGANINSSNRYGTTALHNACGNNQVGAVEFLLQKGALVNVATKSGDSPLHLASKGGFPQIIEKLCKSGADLTLKNSEGMTPLHLAVIENQEGCVKILMQNRADPNIPDNKDQTPLSLCKDEKVRAALQTQATPAQTPGIEYFMQKPIFQVKQAQSEPPKQQAVSLSNSNSDPPTPLTKHQVDNQARRSDMRQPEPIQQQTTPINNQPQPVSLPPSQPDMNRLLQPQSYSQPSTPLRTPFSMEYRQPLVQPPLQFSSSDPTMQMLEMQSQQIQLLREEVRELRELVVVLSQNLMPASLQVKIGQKTAVYRCDGLF